MIEPGAASELLGSRVDLDDRLVLGEEVSVGEVGADEQQQIGVVERLSSALLVLL